jgi:nucleoid DNA-binding protein
MAKSKTTNKSKPAAAAKGNKGGKGAKPGRPMSRSAIVSEVAEKTELPRKKIAEVFDVLTEMLKREVSPGGAGQFKLPTGLLTVKRVYRKERPERMGRDLRTGEQRIIPAKAAHYVVKAYALKSLRDLAGV